MFPLLQHQAEHDVSTMILSFLDSKTRWSMRAVCQSWYHYHHGAVKQQTIYLTYGRYRMESSREKALDDYNEISNLPLPQMDVKLRTVMMNNKDKDEVESTTQATTTVNVEGRDDDVLLFQQDGSAGGGGGGGGVFVDFPNNNKNKNKSLPSLDLESSRLIPQYRDFYFHSTNGAGRFIQQANLSHLHTLRILKLGSSIRDVCIPSQLQELYHASSESYYSDGCDDDDDGDDGDDGDDDDNGGDNDDDGNNDFSSLRQVLVGPGMCQIRSINLAGCKLLHTIGFGGGSRCYNYERLVSNLQHLDLSGCFHLPSTQVTKLLRATKVLAFLRLRHIVTNEMLLQGLVLSESAAAQTLQLVDLSFSREQITDDAMKELLRRSPHIKSLLL